MQLDEIIDQSPLGPVHIRIVAIAALVMFLEGVDIQLIGFVAPRMIAHLAIPSASFGIVFSAGLFGALAGAACFGPLGDRWGRRPLIMASILIFALGTLVTPLAASLWLLVLVRFVASLGLGGVIPNLLALVAEYSPHRIRASLLAGVATSQLAGGMTGGLVSGWFMLRYGWEPLFYGAGLISLLLLPFVAWGLPESLRYLSIAGGHDQRMRRQLHQLYPGLPQDTALTLPAGTARHVPVTALLHREYRLTTLLLWLATAANLFMTAFVIYWLPTLLNKGGMALPTAIFMVSALNGGGLCGGLVLARILDRCSPLKVLIACYLLSALAVAAIGAVMPDIAGVAISATLAGFFALGCYAGVNVIAATVYPTNLRSAGIGWVMALGKFGSIGGPIAASLGLAAGMPLSTVYLIPATGGLVAAGALFWLLLKRPI